MPIVGYNYDHECERAERDLGDPPGVGAVHTPLPVVKRPVWVDLHLRVYDGLLRLGCSGPVNCWIPSDMELVVRQGDGDMIEAYLRRRG
jgi:hypothetical protein